MLPGASPKFRFGVNIQQYTCTVVIEQKLLKVCWKNLYKIRTKCLNSFENAKKHKFREF